VSTPHRKVVHRWGVGLARSPRIRVLVVDDHPVYRDGLVQAISYRPDLELVGDCASGRDAIQAICRLEPEVALLDLWLRDMTAIDVLHAIGDEARTQVVVVSGYANPSTLYDLVAAGARGFLDKSSSRGELCDAVTTVANGRRAFSEEFQNALIREIPRHNANGSNGLSGREHQILILIADGESVRTIGEELHLSEATIKTHLKHIYDKLGVSERAAAVAAAMRRGLLR
jgi:two-component system, NarL family, nitrate/nitrite response regulator NarL